MNAELKATAGPSDFLAPVFAQYPIESRRGGRGCGCTLAMAGASSTFMAGMLSPRSATVIRAGRARSKRKRSACQFPEQRRTDGGPSARGSARLIRFANLGFDSVFFVNSGAEANENALKMAFKITGREEIVALESSFHGRTAAAGALTWGAAQKWYGFPRTPFDVRFISRSDRLPPITRGITRGDGCGHRRAGAGSRRRVRPRPALPTCARRALPRSGRVADLRRGAMRNGPHRLSHSPLRCTALRPI